MKFLASPTQPNPFVFRPALSGIVPRMATQEGTLMFGVHALDLVLNVGEGLHVERGLFQTRET